MSIVRDNLLKDKDYAPYCMGDNCRTMNRMKFNGKQFHCLSCGCTTNFEAEFITKVVSFRAKSNPHTI